jgi:hypothetical protein
MKKLTNSAANFLSGISWAEVFFSPAAAGGDANGIGGYER